MTTNNRYIKILLRSVDYTFIVFKLFMLVILMIDYYQAIGKYNKNVAIHFLIPFLFYGIIGILRIIKYKDLKLLAIEILLNIFFIINVNKGHAYFLILTILSLAITLHLFYKVKILQNNNL